MNIEYVPSKKPATPAAPAQPQPPADPQAPAPSAEQIAQDAKDLYATMGWGEAPPEATTPRILEPAATPANGAAGAPPATPPSRAPIAAEPEPEEPEPTAAQLVSQAARETGREVAAALAPALARNQPATPEPAPVELSEEDRKDLPVLQYLERTNPRKYGGVVKAFMAYVQKHYEYAQAWMAANPDKEYNPDDNEHVAFFSENQPPNISRDEIDEARVDMRVEEKFNRDIKPKFDAQESQRAFEAAIPQINASINGAVLRMVRSVDPALADLLKDASGNEALTDQTVAKIDEADPIAKEIMDRIVSQELEPMVLELEKTAIPGMNFRLDPRRNMVHSKISEFVAKRESDLRSAPVSQRILDGKKWVSLSDYSRMATEIQNGAGSDAQKAQAIRDLDDSVWCLDTEMIRELMVDYCAAKARSQIQKQDVLAQKKYGTTRKAGPSAPQPQPQPQPTPAAGRPGRPAGGGDSVSVTTPISGSIPAKTYGEEATSVMFGR